MITGELKNKIDGLWDIFAAGGLVDPLDVIEQVTYLMFIRDLDDTDNLRARESAMLGLPYTSIFAGEVQIGERKISGEQLKWSVFHDFPAGRMYSVMQEWVFPFIKGLHEDKNSAYSKYMDDAIFKLPTPLLLSKVVDCLDDIYRQMAQLHDSDIRGDVYEYLLSKISQSGRNGQFRTPRHIIRMVVEMMEPKPDNVICEPSMGVGNFFGLLPEAMQGSKLYGVELDSITGRIARQLYPHADIKVAGFETTDRRDFYDLAVGNVPFGDYKVNDRPYNKLGFSIHNYFFAKALDQVRPGGVVAFVTSRYTMDAKSPEVRKYLAQRAELLGAIRLPNNAFRANAGTDVVSDIIFLQKRETPIDIDPDWVHLGQTPDGFAINSYFVDHPEMVMGELTSQSTQYGREECTVAPIPGADLAEQLHEAVSHIQGNYQAVELSPEDSLTPGTDTIPADPNVKNFSFAAVNGEVYFREDSVMRHVALSDTARQRALGMISLRQTVNELIEYQLEDYPDEAIQAKQHELELAYDAFTAKYGLLNSRPNARVFGDDSSYYLLCSLEDVDEDGKLIGKADMFTKRTIRPDRSVTSVDTPVEALAVSIGEQGRVDLPFMSELLGTPGEFDRIIEELSGVIFLDPLEANAEDRTKGWHTADDYLSGNVGKRFVKIILRFCLN